MSSFLRITRCPIDPAGCRDIPIRGKLTTQLAAGPHGLTMHVTFNLDWSSITTHLTRHHPTHPATQPTLTKHPPEATP